MALHVHQGPGVAGERTVWDSHPSVAANKGPSHMTELPRPKITERA